MSLPIAWGPLLLNLLWAGAAAAGMAIYFNVPLRTLLGCALCGASAFTTRSLLMDLDHFSIELATGVAASLVTILGVFFGRRWHVPAIIYIVPGVIPLVPGVRAFQTMIDILILTTDGVQVNDTLLIDAAVNSIETTLIVCAIAGGIAIPILLFRRRRPMT